VTPIGINARSPGSYRSVGSKILGHANPAITMSIYAHELVEDFEQVRVAMAKFA
jgi:hypothetical protein